MQMMKYDKHYFLTTNKIFISIQENPSLQHNTEMTGGGGRVETFSTTNPGVTSSLPSWTKSFE